MNEEKKKQEEDKQNMYWHLLMSWQLLWVEKMLNEYGEELNDQDCIFFKHKKERRE